MADQFNTPVLFIVFNRPNTTARVLAEIKKQQPRYLFVAADGPRRANKDDEAKIAEVKAIIKKEVDWSCELKTLYQENNLGCKKAVSGAIGWFFSQVEEGVILEDDCLPDQSFFRFCEELLNYYRNDSRIMQVGGANFQMGNKRGESSYYFSTFNHIWGWATWRRAWKLFDLKMTEWPKFKRDDLINRLFNSRVEQTYWSSVMQDMYDNKIDTWDYAWAFACWKNNGLTCLPNKNLVTNVGFTTGATHSIYHLKNVANVSLSNMDFSLIHPKAVIRDVVADSFTNRNHYHLTAVSFYLKKLLKKLGLFKISKLLAVKMRD
ncbi:MAG: hypothetical protein A3J93_01025 [Candidatus Magasanikbacteria bacterium RIFOXYC2_FULL_42_28]|uniref:Nucleotide-diphospho-sugar transferase n=1 Tax=Candidatus Magasanikbacteria bacterium RIFOXYC2_FULL_42_28 TaxID=1798704 RepID=A0A1F6NXQ2_9BACT|nr:MAG: hypothetical protein A3J93_01025 [Candidatus Magasanikbacteria bacterium RIFOXYC2_FULL_42_28]